VSASGDLYIADTFNNEVDEVSPTGKLSVVAGTGVAGAVVPGRATRSPLNHPTGVAVTASGALYVADTFESQVVKVSRAGIISVVAGTGAGGQETVGPAKRSELNYCYAVATDTAGNVYIADTFNHVVEKVSLSGRLTVIAGTGASGLPSAGPPSRSNLEAPDGVVVTKSGVMYISDYDSNEVVKVVP
jgi:sugar lactone lactonase YvrE